MSSTIILAVINLPVKIIYVIFLGLVALFRPKNVEVLAKQYEKDMESNIKVTKWNWRN